MKGHWVLSGNEAQIKEALSEKKCHFCLIFPVSEESYKAQTFFVKVSHQMEIAPETKEEEEIS